MVSVLLELVLAITATIVLYYAYAKNSNLARLSVFTILAALLLTAILSGVANVFGEVDLFEPVVNIFNQLAGFVGYAEIVLLLVLLFLSPHKTKSNTLKVSLIIYVVLQLLITLNIF